MCSYLFHNSTLRWVNTYLILVLYIEKHARWSPAQPAVYRGPSPVRQWCGQVQLRGPPGICTLNELNIVVWIKHYGTVPEPEFSLSVSGPWFPVLNKRKFVDSVFLNAFILNDTSTLYIIYKGVRHFKIGLRNDSCTECCGSGSVGFELFRIRSRILVIFIRIRNTHFLYQKNNFHTKKQDPGLQHLQYFDNFTGSLWLFFFLLFLRYKLKGVNLLESKVITFNQD